MQTSQPSKVEIINTNGYFQLLVNKKPFYINGAGLEFGDITALAHHNGNSFRTWRTENGVHSAKEVLDEALKHGLMVAMGIEVGRERHGFDYDNRVLVEEQLEKIKSDIFELKDHPALLLWVIGNELNLKYTNPKVWDAVNEISEMIHQIDPNHPTTTPLAGITQIEINYIRQRCKDLDCLSIQLYGELNDLPKLIKEYGWTGPYIITEWGVTGHWEVPETSWGAPIEETSTMKAKKCLQRYIEGIKANSKQCLGSYIFLWGQKQERTPTWYGLFTENGRITEVIDVVSSLWKNHIITIKAPQIDCFLLQEKTAYDNVILRRGEEVTAILKLKTQEIGVNYEWELLPESTDLKDGGDREKRPENIDIQLLSKNGNVLKFIVPVEGTYRLFVYITNDINRVATANIPFLVK